MKNTAMSKGKEHLRVVNSDSKGKRMAQPEVPWKTIAITSAIAAIAGAGAIELAKFFLTKGKKVVDAEPNPQALPPGMPGGPGGGMPALPGAVSPNMFQNPYAQMQAMQGQGFPAPFQNPMVTPESDEPPKWFDAFKQQYDADQQRVDNLEKQSAAAHAARLANSGRPPQFEEEEEEYEDDD